MGGPRPTILNGKCQRGCQIYVNQLQIFAEKFFPLGCRLSHAVTSATASDIKCIQATGIAVKICGSPQFLASEPCTYEAMGGNSELANSEDSVSESERLWHCCVARAVKLSRD